MKKNMGRTDRLTRLLVAAVLVALNYAFFPGTIIGTIFLVFAGVMVVTSFIGFCPLYTIFGINTCVKKK